MTRRVAAAGVLVLLLLAGCSGLPRHRDAAGQPGRPPTAPPAPGPAADATAQLLREAGQAATRGETARAAALLERAIRLAPGDPLPWSRLAALRLDAGQGAQAEQLAVRSNRLAGTDAALQARNWRIIAAGRRLAEDVAGARDAEAQAERLEAR